MKRRKRYNLLAQAFPRGTLTAPYGRRSLIFSLLACLPLFLGACKVLDFPHAIPGKRTIKDIPAKDTRLVVPQEYRFSKYVIPAGIYLPDHEQWERIFYKAPAEVGVERGWSILAKGPLLSSGISFAYKADSQPILKYSTVQETFNVPIPADFEYRIEKNE